MKPSNEQDGMSEYDAERARMAASLDGSRIMAKASMDPFYYVARLKSGETFKFEYAHHEKGSEFIEFKGLENISGVPEKMLTWSGNFERGLEVRKDQVAWIGDGSS
jgi:hypothetical protein